MTMQIHDVRCSKRIGTAMLGLAAFIAAAAAHADPGKDLGAALTTQLLDSTRQCAAADEVLTKLRFPTGTKFLLTDAGLVALDQPRPRPSTTNWEPEWPNTGN
jgi:hypothetical protein